MGLSALVTALRSFHEQKRIGFLIRCTTQVWTVVLGHTASMASAKPVSPSQQTTSTSVTPRFLSSVMTPSQNLAPSSPLPSHRPNTCLRPSTSTGHGDIDGPVHHHMIGTDFDHDRIQIEDRIHRIQRPLLPGTEFGHNGVGDLGDQLSRDLYPVDLLQVGPGVTGRHPPRHQRDDQLVEPPKTALMFRDQLRFERGVAISGHLHAHRAGICLGPSWDTSRYGCYPNPTRLGRPFS